MPRRHMRLLRRSGMPLALATPLTLGTFGVPRATRAAVISTGTDQKTKLASHEPTSGRITGSVSEALINSPTRSPFDHTPVARAMSLG
jgi:hypothetical protein